MRIVLLCHPAFVNSTSMKRFAEMLRLGLSARGETVEILMPPSLFQSLVRNANISKWLGYIDQFIIFPVLLCQRIRTDPPETIYSVCDEALGPWVPFIRHRPHVVHCHDQLNLPAAIGSDVGNRLSRTGKLYQRFIRWGYRKGRFFIFNSHQTKANLHVLGGITPVSSTVINLALNFDYHQVDRDVSRQEFERYNWDHNTSYILHVSNLQWYKNPIGIIRIYCEYAIQHLDPLPLWMVSPIPCDPGLVEVLSDLPTQARVVFISGLDDQPALRALYSRASVLLFPSHVEGFGWPIIEAISCQCQVLTTHGAPMTEVGGELADYLPSADHFDNDDQWAEAGAQQLVSMLGRTDVERSRWMKKAALWAARFAAEPFIDRNLAFYRRVLTESCLGVR